MSALVSEDMPEAIVGLPAWQRTVASNFAVATIKSSDSGFAGVMRTTHLDGIQVSRVLVPPHTVDRTNKHIGPHESSRFVLCLQLKGHSTVSQEGRTASLSPGDMTIYDTARPYTLVHDDEVTCIGVVIPEGRVNLSASTVRPLLATLMTKDDLFTGATFEAIDKFQQGADLVGNPTRYRLGQTFASLFETLCMSWLARTTTENFDPRAGLRESIVSFIEDNLSDPELDPSMIAAAHFISVRSLHGLAKQGGSTIASMIRDRRLEHCRADLSNPSLAHLTVAEIAARWGFTHAPHFATLFRRSFGVTPSSVRRGGASG